MNTVRFARYPGESAKIIFAPLLLGIERGYFAEAGITVEIIEPVDHPWQTVARGEAEAGVGYIDYCAQPKYLGRIKAVAVHERLSAGRGLPALLARPALLDRHELGADADLRGKRIGLTWGRGDDYLTFFGVLHSGGLQITDVEIVPVPHSGAERDRALETGAIDVIIGRRPRHVAEEEAAGFLRRWRVGSEIFPDWQNRFIIFNTAFSERDPAVGKAFMKAYQRGAADYLNGTESGLPSAAFLPELVRLSSETPALLNDSLPGGFPVDAAIDMPSLRRDIGLLIDAELYPREVPLEQIVDLHFV